MTILGSGVGGLGGSLIVLLEGEIVETAMEENITNGEDIAKTHSVVRFCVCVCHFADYPVELGQSGRSH